MKRNAGIAAIFTAGLLLGSILPIDFPLAQAHPESECPKCECPEPPPCPVLDQDGDGIPDTLDAQLDIHHPQHVEEEDEEAIRKALEAIEKAEEQEARMEAEEAAKGD
jgi:hypothetical protein